MNTPKWARLKKQAKKPFKAIKYESIKMGQKASAWLAKKGFPQRQTKRNLEKKKLVMGFPPEQDCDIMD